jgi:hypothetical protein
MSYDSEGNEMKRTLSIVTLLIWLTVAFVLVLPQSPIMVMNKTVAAAPDIVQYSSSPTNHSFVPVGGVRTGTEALRAYDGTNSTYASWSYTRTATYGGQDGYIEFNVYGPRTGPPRGSRITQVDLKVVFRVLVIASVDAQLQLSYLVGPSPTETVLYAWNRAPAAWYNNTYTNQAEPNNGAWSWEDVSNIKFRFNRRDPNTVDSSGTTSLYEVWAKVYYEAEQTVAIWPKTQSPVPSQIKINVTAIEELYGFEFKMTYNTTAMTVTSVQLGSFLNNTASAQGGSTFGALIELNDAEGFVWATQSIRGNLRGGNVASGAWQTLATINIAPSTGPTNVDFDIKLAGLNYLTKEVYPASFTLIQPGHDVAVTNVVAAPISVTRGENVNVGVTVKNEGDYIETFYLLTYANTSAGVTLIENRTITGLGLGATQVVPITWSTRDFGAGNYTVSATAVTRGVIDADSADNTKYGNLVEVNPLFGDITQDGWVDESDLVAIDFAWGTQHGDDLFNLYADLNTDSIIDVRDLRLLGEAWEPSP